MTKLVENSDILHSLINPYNILKANLPAIEICFMEGFVIHSQRYVISTVQYAEFQRLNCKY